MRTPIRDAARGHWRGILSALGVENRLLSGKNTQCPFCQDRKLRFRFTDRNGEGVSICSNCKPGDGFGLLMKLNGWDFKRTAEAVEEVLGTTPPDPKRPERTAAQNRQAMVALWKAASPIAADDPAGLYLRRRTGLVTYPAVLRVVTDPIWTRGRPAMVAKVVHLDGKGAQLHRTLLTEDGLKAPVDSPRMMMPGQTPPGVAVRLFDQAEHLGVAEGIETALSAASLFGVPCWAALNADNLKVWNPPAGVTRVTVFGDNDVSFKGHSAAYELGRRLRVQKLDVDVQIPPTPGFDWNKVHELQVAA